jgi:hypothetical protein
VNRLVAEVAQVEGVGKHKAMYGCISRTEFGLMCTYELLKIVQAGKSISLGVIHTHWKRLSLEEADFVRTKVVLLISMKVLMIPKYSSVRDKR